MTIEFPPAPITVNLPAHLASSLSTDQIEAVVTLAAQITHHERAVAAQVASMIACQHIENVLAELMPKLALRVDLEHVAGRLGEAIGDHRNLPAMIGEAVRAAVGVVTTIDVGQYEMALKRDADGRIIGALKLPI